VLFLISDTGAGHRRAANAIHQAMLGLQANAKGLAAASGLQPRQSWRAIIVDAFDKCSRFPLREGISLYGPAIKYSPRLYGEVFRATNTRHRFELARRVCQPFLKEGLRRLFERTHPDVVVSVHPLLNHVTVEVLNEIGLHIPVVTVITDLLNIHCAWIEPGVTACVVATAEARDAAIAHGLAPDRIHPLGFPIDPRFADVLSKSREEARIDLHLDTDLPVILLIGGGEGAGGLGEAALSLARSSLDAQLVVITGRNRVLQDRLHRLASLTMPVHVRGFVNNVQDYMRATDVVVTKAGPGTISEAIACELPIVLTGAVPGQEPGNIGYVVDNGVGQFARHAAELPTILSDVLGPRGSQLLAAYRRNAKRLSHANASGEIASLILSFLPTRRAPSSWERAQQQSTTRCLIAAHPGMTANLEIRDSLLPRIGTKNAATGVRASDGSANHRPST
jgi:1,2-diacylglycerol 3-beta-galactosyltransferase